MVFDDLAALRAEVSTLDRRLVELAAERHALVRRIAETKRARGGETPLFDRRREAEVLRRAAEDGARVELPVGVAERLLRTLIEASHETQEALLRDVPSGATHAAPGRLLVVGGAGQMGRLLLRAFGDRGLVVEAIDAPGSPIEASTDRPGAVARADVVIVSVPMDRAVAIVEEIAPHVREDALLCDINSLKRDVCAAMERSCRGEALGLHPMFGPTVPSLRRQKVVVCPVRDGPRARWLRGELGRMGIELVETDPTTHDRMMAVVQVLVHYATLVMGDALRAAGTSLEESLRYTSPIYRLELSVVGRLFTQDPDLYAEIIMQNPESGTVLRHFLDSATEIDAIIRRGDRESFREHFHRAGAHFEGFAEEAMALSDAVIDMLAERP